MLSLDLSQSTFDENPPGDTMSAQIKGVDEDIGQVTQRRQASIAKHLLEGPHRG